MGLWTYENVIFTVTAICCPVITTTGEGSVVPVIALAEDVPTHEAGATLDAQLEEPVSTEEMLPSLAAVAVPLSLKPPVMSLMDRFLKYWGPLKPLVLSAIVQATTPDPEVKHGCWGPPEPNRSILHSP